MPGLRRNQPGSRAVVVFRRNHPGRLPHRPRCGRQIRAESRSRDDGIRRRLAMARFGVARRRRRRAPRLLVRAALHHEARPQPHGLPHSRQLPSQEFPRADGVCAVDDARIVHS